MSQLSKSKNFSDLIRIGNNVGIDVTCIQKILNVVRSLQTNNDNVTFSTVLKDGALMLKLSRKEVDGHVSQSDAEDKKQKDEYFRVANNFRSVLGDDAVQSETKSNPGMYGSSKHATYINYIDLQGHTKELAATVKPPSPSPSR